MAAVASSSNLFQSSLFLAHSESFAPAQRRAFHNRTASAPTNEQASSILRQPRGPPSGPATAHTSSWRQRARPAELPLQAEPSTTTEAPASPGKSPKSPKSPKRRGGRRSATPRSGTPRSASPSVSEDSWRSRSSSPAPFKAARSPLPVVETPAPASAAPIAEGPRVYSLVDLLALSVSPLVGVSAKDEAHMEDLVLNHTWRRGPQGTSSRSSSRSPSPSPSASRSSSRASSPARRTSEGRRRAPSPSKLRESVLNAEDSD
ncbi:hypothetical protein OF83DRAFT_1081514 [Amylostereum chailletii]|nr:hypothetical protein OF83DRAFT_1081514 [Amylostereum chailletii]